MKVWEIVRIIEESPVKVVSSDLDLDVEFQTPDGHRYEVFMDCGEPDYLTWFQPAGQERIEFWPENDDDNRAMTALGYLAGNLLHLPHVDERLKLALKEFTEFDWSDY